MTQATPCSDQSAKAPQEFRHALAELVQIGLRVARLVGMVADAETALAEAAAQAGVEDGVSALAGSLAEAIEADRACAAAAQGGTLRNRVGGRVKPGHDEIGSSPAMRRSGASDR